MLAKRAHSFLCWAVDRPETSIGVTTHCLFLLALFHGVLRVSVDDVQLFRNCELRSIGVIEESPAEAGPAPLLLLERGGGTVNQA